MECGEYANLLQPKYLKFFSNEDSEYLYSDGIHMPHYLGVAYELVLI